MNETAWRICAALCGVLAGAIFIALMSVIFPACVEETSADGDSQACVKEVSAGGAPPVCANEVSAGRILLDRGSSLYPFTIQNLMWLLFFVSLGDLLVRFLRGGRELRQMNLRLLPQDEETLLRAKDLGEIYAQVRPAPQEEANFLQRLISRVVLQFQSSRSVGQAHTLLNSSLELFQHEIDLKYNMMRYMVWLIPTLGFIGTVIGIALALGEAGNLPDMEQPECLNDWMEGLTGSLGLAFNTTLMALLLSAVLVFLMHIAQGREETALNRAGQYCLDNLINRLYEK